MDLAKLNIKPLPPADLANTFPQGFDVLFNPNTYSIVKPVSWTQPVATGAPAGQGRGTYRDLDAPPLVFGGGGARTLTLQLFFDVTEGGANGTTTDVRTETNKIVALTRIDRSSKQPPVCTLSWGAAVPSGSDFPFDGVVTNLTQNFVMFRANGVPVRANLTVAFMEYIEPQQNKRQNDPDLTTYTIKRGDSLSAIAAQLYRDASLWRLIAVANGIDDPRHLRIGARLAIPRPS